MTNKYDELDATFKQLEKNRGNILFDMDEIKTPEHINKIKNMLEVHGLIIIKNAISDVSVDNLRDNIADAAIKMIGEGHSLEEHNLWKQDLMEINKFRNPKSGLGNSSFGYFFKQPYEDTLTTTISNETLYVTQNYGYQVNLNLLLDNKHTTAVLLALTHPKGGMVSWDSFKLANNPKPKPAKMTKQTLTACHIDMYNDDADRYQAIISIEEKIKLGFVPDSINENVKKQICSILNKKNFYSNGFKSISDKKLIDVFNKYVIAPPSGSLILWKSGTIHYEAEFENNYDTLCKYISSKNLFDELRVRCVVGLHKIVNLDNNEIIELARLAENGIIPEVYGHINKNNKIYNNIMSSKTTQYKIKRKISDNEKNIMLHTINNKDHTIFNDMSNLKKYLYGINTSINNLELDDCDKLLIN
jgi:hypothetical protein